MRYPDAGWVPHVMYRVDHAYNRHRCWLATDQELSKLPSEHFACEVDLATLSPAAVA